MAYNTKVQLMLYKFENSQFVKKAIIDDYYEISFTRNYYEAGDFTITINKNIPNASLFRKGLFVRFGNDNYDMGEIISISNSVGPEGKASETLIINGKDLRYIFHRRVIRQDNANGNWEMTGAGEIVMRSLIRDQCGSGAEVKRRLPITNVIPENGIGDTCSISESFTNLYEVLITIATQTNTGWRIRFENGEMTLEFFRGIDRSTNVFFTVSHDALQDGTFTDSSESYANTIYVGGQGQGDERDIYEGETGSPEGFDRFEAWDDQSSMTSEAEYQAEANAMLTQYGQTLTVSGNVLAKNPYVYKQEYDVGDLIKIGFSGQEATVQILSVTESWSGRGNYNIAFEFGKPVNTLGNQLQLILRQIRKAGNKTSSTDSVRWYTIPTDTEMPKADVTYNTIGFIGDCGNDGKTFKLYFDSNKTGSKSYHVWFKQLAGTGKLTLTTGVAGKQNLEMDSGTYVAIIYVDQEGNVLNQANAVSVNSAGGQSAGTASTITVNGKTYDVGGGGDSISVGFIQPQYKKVNRAGWLYLDGSTFDENQYPALYLYLGTNVLPDYREFGLVGAEENTTDVYDETTNPSGTIHDHDVYAEGQAKDDQLQNITDSFQSARASNKANTDGAFYTINTSSSDYSIDATDSAVGHSTYGLNASRVVRAGTTTHGKRKAVYFYIKAIDGETIADENQFMGTVKNYLKTAESYSTEEVATGGTWIDGKPIYRKVASISTALINGGSWTSILQVSESISLIACSIVDYPHPSTTVYENGIYRINNGYIQVIPTGQGWNATTSGSQRYLIYEYTKTTN